MGNVEFAIFMPAALFWIGVLFFIVAFVAWRISGMSVAQSIMHTSLVCIFAGLAFGMSLTIAQGHPVIDTAMLMVVGVLLPARSLIYNWHAGLPLVALLIVLFAHSTLRMRF